MIFDKLIEEQKLIKLLDNIEKSREKCKTQEGIECLDDLEYKTAEELDKVLDFITNY